LSSIVLVAACSATPKAKAPTTPAEWTTACSARLEAARTKLGLGGATTSSTIAWNPSVHFLARVGAGHYEASVQHGQDACIDFDSDDPSFINLKWSNGHYASTIALHRIRRVERDEAALEADKVPRETIEPFRKAFEQALESCLEDARHVTLGPISKDVSCMDKQDRCPNAPEDADPEDGCPQ
jgi:hypothetical protein